MTELQLYKYITENDIEYHWRDNKGREDVVILPYIFQLEEFRKMFPECCFDGGIECTLIGSYIAIWMYDICELLDIKLESVFKKT